MKLVLISILLGNFTATSYRSVPSQTDDTPFFTSTGEHVCKDGIAVSQDLLKSKRLKYGDWIYIEDIGLKRVNDTMNVRFKNCVDVWVSSLVEEKRFYKKFKDRNVKVWIVTFTEEK